jgi:hypothetical protein
MLVNKLIINVVGQKEIAQKRNSFEIKITLDRYIIYGQPISLLGT